MQAFVKERGKSGVKLMIDEINHVHCFSIAPDLGSPKTMNKLLESKENKLAATYNIQPVSCEKITLRRRQPVVKLTPDLAPEFHYPLYPLEPDDILSAHTTPQKKIFFLQNDEDRTSPVNEFSTWDNQRDDVKSVTTKTPSTSSYNCSSNVPDVKKVPDYMNIPNLWNVQVVQSEAEKKTDEKEECHPESSSSSSEWELV